MSRFEMSISTIADPTYMKRGGMTDRTAILAGIWHYTRAVLTLTPIDVLEKPEAGLPNSPSRTAECMAMEEMLTQTVTAAVKAVVL